MTRQDHGSIDRQYSERDRHWSPDLTGWWQRPGLVIHRPCPVDEPTSDSDERSKVANGGFEGDQAAFANFPTLISPSCSRACASS